MADQDRQRLLKRPERRRALIDAATRAFARAGFAATSLDDVATEAGVSRVLIYRHFASKAELYQAVLDEIAGRLVEATGGPDRLNAGSIEGLVRVARQSPDGFRLFFRHASQEPEFRQHADWLRAAMTGTARPYLEQRVPDEAHRRWAAALVPVIVIEAVIAWLDAGSPGPDSVARTLDALVDAVVGAVAGSG